jgi:phage portal protein BeeE
VGLRSWWADIQGTAAPVSERLSFQEWVDSFTFDGMRYPLGYGSGLTGQVEEIAAGYRGYVEGGYRANSVVFACIAKRMALFSEAKFIFRQYGVDGPGKLFGTAALGVLHRPWTGGTTGDLLAMMDLDVSLGGNAFILRRGSRLVRLRPDWTTIVLGTDDPDSTMWDVDAEVIGYVYLEGGPGSGKEPKSFLANQVAHYMPHPDPIAPRRGMSWMTPAIREIQGDSAYTNHKNAFMDNGATVNLVLEYEPTITKELFEFAVDAFKEGHEGAANAGKTLHLLGATAKSVGADFQQMDFKSVQGAGETRIAMDSGVHPVILGMSEGLAGSSLNAGNFDSARRLVADTWLRPMWRNVSGSLANIIDVPSDGELWYDDRDIPFVQEVEKDTAEIQQVQSQTLRTLVDGGFTPESAVAALKADDMSKLKHTGLLPVQLQAPGTQSPEPATNGNGPMTMEGATP